MKKQILTLIIGILIGAIATTSVFLIFKDKTKGYNGKMNRDDMPEINGNFQGEYEGPGRRNKENIQETNVTNEISNAI